MRAKERHHGLGQLPASLALLFLCWMGSGAEAQVATSASHVLSQATGGGAGAGSTSASFVLDGTLAQDSVVGEATSASFVLQSGFWTSGSTTATLLVLGSGSGSGSMTGQGITCTTAAGIPGGDCKETVVHGNTLVVTAAPDPANSFDGWIGCDSLSTTVLPGDTCEVLMTASREVTAAFTALGSLGDLVWRDVDGDGLQGPGEPGIDGVTVNLAGPSGPLSTVTSGGGLYGFADLSPGTYTVTVEAATLPPGVFPSFDFDGTASPHVAEVPVADGQDRLDVDFGYQPMVDLSILKEDSEDPLPGGSNLVYTLTVENLGPAPATGVVVTDDLPAGVTLVATSGCAEDPVAVPTCTLGDLAIGASTSYTIEVSIDPAPPASITNFASVSGTETDPVASNDSDSETTTLDASAPRVVLVNTDAATADGELVDCETVHRRRIDRLLVTFDEAMQDAAGDASPGDVTNPASWLLVQAGPDAELSTTDCGAPAGDDLEVPVSAITYDPGSATATLQLAEGLSGDLYRLFACGSGASFLRDLAGNALDGDGNGSGGDDFLRFFRADPRNLLANGHFDCDLGDWVAVSTNPSEIDHSQDDEEGSADSGSAAVANLTGSTDFALGQCLPAAAAAEYVLAASVRMEAAAPGIGLRLSCSFFGGAACTGASLGTPSTSTALLADTGESWIRLSDSLQVPAGAASSLCSIDFITAAGASFEARVDRLELLGDVELFADGFESGDTSAWSAAVTGGGTVENE